jgi:hypothetical protein
MTGAAGARWYELTHDRFLHPMEQANAMAMRRSQLAYWGEVLPATALVTVLLTVHPWAGGPSGVWLRVALAVFALVGLTWAFRIVVRRRLRSWQSCEQRRKGNRLAAIGRKLLVFLVVLFGLILLFSAVGSLDNEWNRCGSSAVANLYRPATVSGACLQQSSASVDGGLASMTVLLAALLAYAGSVLNRRIAIRRWRRAERRTTTAGPNQEPGRAVAPDQGTTRPSTEVAS